jgi:uncharacterized protein YkwD
MTFSRILLLGALLLVPLSVFAATPETHFHARVLYTASEDEKAVMAEIHRYCREINVEAPDWDYALSMAARTLSERLAETKMRETDSLDSRKIRAAIQEQGGTDSAIRTQVGNMTRIKGAREMVRHQMSKEFAGERYTHVGIGTESKLLPPMKYVTIILSRRPVYLEPFPRDILPGGKHFLRGVVNGKSNDLKILLRLPTSQIKTISPHVSPDGTFEQQIPFYAGAGIYHIEVQVSGSGGPEISALFDVRLIGETSRETERAPYFVVPDLPKAENAVEAEAQVYSLINMARESAKKVHVFRNAELDQVARKYAQQMMNGNFVAHVDPDGKDVSDRVKAANIKYQLVAENVAVNETAVLAHKSLMESPAHAAMILDERFTKVGVGVAMRRNRERSSIYVVEVFMLPR